MTTFEVIVIHTIAAVFLISQHLVSSSDQCYNATVKLIPANDSCSCNVSTYQLLGVHHFGCAQDEEELLLFILSQANNSVSYEYDSCCDAGLQEGLCKNNTWEALCNTCTQCHACHHNDCVNNNQSTSIAMNPSSTETVTPGKSILTDNLKDLVMILSVAIGLLTLLLIVVTIVAITICNRMRKQNKSLTREIQEYEMISKYSAVRHDSNSLPERYSAIKKRDSNRKQPILPPAHLAADYLTPTMTKTTGSISENPETNSDTKKNQEEKVNTDESKNLDSEAKEETKRNDKDSDENPYQSLIVPMANATSVTIDGYVKIIRSRVGSLDGQETPAPKTPPIPPKPESDYSLKSSIPQLSLASELPPMSENMYASRSGTL